MSKLPEPPQTSAGRKVGLMGALKKALASRGFGRFLVVLALKSFLVAMAIPFLVVYMKRVYGQGDSTVVFFTVMTGFS